MMRQSSLTWKGHTDALGYDVMGRRAAWSAGLFRTRPDSFDIVITDIDHAEYDGANSPRTHAHPS